MTREERIELFTRLHALETALLHIASVDAPGEGIDDLGELADRVADLLTGLWPTVESLRGSEAAHAVAQSDLLAARLLATLPTRADAIGTQAEVLEKRGSRSVVAA